ncbi:hypothetical protein A2V68_00535 [candidate division Kazan bacterium RBG_13_50_9]|uniref:Uncharacterized protein n=1 Tax=candidate division Kazan bacterium RBG_13_50_9 TaxID=1798535 RepID=A0A1F4NTN2_UNCK3|nr:MAG: hypothetical protein A2V68_00535 [candidate division Kazan bacterium RBG_13_50_9]
MGKEKELVIWRVKMAYWETTKIDEGWSKHELFVEASSRGEAVKKAAEAMDYEMLPVASGAKGEYFLAFCYSKGIKVVRALHPKQVRAYIKSVLGYFPKYSIWSVTATKDRSSELSLPPPTISQSLPHWQCPHCDFEDEERRRSDNEGPCRYCGLRPNEDDAVIAHLFTTPSDHP